MTTRVGSESFLKHQILNSRLFRKLVESASNRAAELIRAGGATPPIAAGSADRVSPTGNDKALVRQAVEEAAHLLRREYTVMPRFAYHQPIDYHEDSPAPVFEPSVFVPNVKLPLPSAVDRMGYPADDAEYLAWGEYDANLVRSHISKHLGLRRDLAIMDFGCSTGRVLRHFHDDHTTLNWQLYGVDIQARCIEWLRRNFPNEFIVYTGTVMPILPFEDNSLDVIFGFSVFTHVKYLWDTWLMELRRVLKPGGLLIQTIHAENAWTFYHKHRTEEWVTSNHSARVYDHPEMDMDWFHHGDISVSQAFWKQEVARQFWGRYMTVLDILPPPEKYSFQDWIICQKPERAPAI